MQRNDNANAYWKEKFVYGLPTLFANKVRDKMVEQKNEDDWLIDLETWTYGEIIQAINITVMQLCNDLRLKNQLKKQKLTTKREFGSWCEQFGFDKLPTSTERRTKDIIHKPYMKKKSCPQKKRYKNNEQRNTKYQNKKLQKKHSTKPEIKIETRHVTNAESQGIMPIDALNSKIKYEPLKLMIPLNTS